MTALQQKLQVLFDPKSIAFIGASNTPGKWGYHVLNNLIKGGFQGVIYPINPKEKEVLGIKAYASVKALPEKPDLALIVIPPPAVPSAIDDCVKKGIPAGVVITAGFAEAGGDGVELQRLMVEKAKKGGMVLVGPNCNGLVRPSKKIYAQRVPIFQEKGHIAVVSQSGNLATSFGIRGIKKGVGFSSIVSTGNQADLHSEDFFDFLADDPETKVVLSYIEGSKNGRHFFDSAKRLTQKKPLVMIKAGSTTAGAKAANSHTASLAGSNAVFEGLCKQSGITRTDSLDNLFNMGLGFLNQPLPRGNRVGIITMGGGWGVLAADASAKHGLDVVSLSAKTISKLKKNLPSWWNPGNPVDMVGGNMDGALLNSLRIILEAHEIDCVILLGIMGMVKAPQLAPNADPEAIEFYIQEILRQLSDGFDLINKLSLEHQKPVITATEHTLSVGDLEYRMMHMLGKKGMTCYSSPGMTARMMSELVNYSQYLRNGINTSS